MADPITVPDVVGVAQSEAERRIAGEGQSVGNITEEASATIPKGSVISSKPAADQPAGDDKKVDLVISSGPATEEDTKAIVPPLANLTPDAARAALKEANLQASENDTREFHNDTPAGQVIRSDPKAGDEVDKGTTVELIVSMGAPVQVTVPNVVGLTTMAAEAALKSAGLVLGTEASVRSHAIPTGGVIASNPPAGAVVNQTSKVKVEVSAGELFDPWQYKTTFMFGALGLVAIGLIVRGVWGATPAFFVSLRDTEVARGLITFLIAASTISIAIILTFSTIMLTENNNARDRFDRGKQILTMMIGVLGTIVGFYFGSADREGKAIEGVQITTSAIPDGQVGVDYNATAIRTIGGTPPFKWTVTPDLPGGLELDADTGQISGKPSEEKSEDYKVTVRDSGVPSKSDTAGFKLTVKKAAPAPAP